MSHYKEWMKTDLVSSDAALKAIRSIEQIHNEFRSELVTDHIHMQIHAQQFSDVAERFSAANDQLAEKPKWGELPSKAHADMCLLLIYKLGDPIRLLDTYLNSRFIAVVQLLDSCCDSMRSGNLLANFILFRSMLEQIAQLHEALQELPKELDLPSKFPDAYEVTESWSVQFQKLLFGRRFDWFALNERQVQDMIANREYQYKAEPGEVDFRSKQIMKSIDNFSKIVPHARGTYELLCEFAHPNMGVLYTLTKSYSTQPDYQGIYWDTMRIGLGMPSADQKDVANIFLVILETMAEALVQFRKDLVQFQQERHSLLEIIQGSLKTIIIAYPELLDSHSLCPCGSGEKLKSCCDRAS